VRKAILPRRTNMFKGLDKKYIELARKLEIKGIMTFSHACKLYSKGNEGIREINNEIAIFKANHPDLYPVK
jgi:hypothetical protein